jgi:hypothetical protein
MLSHTLAFEDVFANKQFIIERLIEVPGRYAINDINTTGYQSISDLLNEANDAHFGIISRFDGETNTWVRDATNATPLAERISHHAPVIEANNALLRCLSRLRAIDFAVRENFKSDSSKQELRNQLLLDIKTKFITRLQAVLEIAQSEVLTDKEKNKTIEGYEAQFNNFLIDVLHRANLTQGCETIQDAEKLLLHYRNLSSLIDPARTLVTLTYDKDAKIIARETQYPVTEKTQAQKDVIQELKHCVPDLLKQDKTAHLTLNEASQKADSLFADLMLENDRLLPAHARKTHLVGAKNAYVVRMDLFEGEEPDNWSLENCLRPNHSPAPGSTLFLARSGSPVYVGPAETQKRIQDHTVENIKQIRDTAKALMGSASDIAVHITTLNTDSPLKNQSTIIKHIYKATENDQTIVSYMPTNFQGLFHRTKIASKVSAASHPKRISTGPQLLRKAERLERVAQVIQAAAGLPGTISLVNCASGQDRTGTAVELTIQSWMRDYYSKKNKPIFDLEASRARGGNAAEIAALLLPGSSGMKSDSKADNFLGKRTFSRLASREWYRHSAQSNTKNKVFDVSCLKVPNALLLEDYQKNLQDFNSLLTSPGDEKQLAAGRSVLDVVKAIGGEAGAGVSFEQLSDLNWVLKTSITSFRSPNDPANLRHMAGLSKKLTKQSLPSIWQRLGTALVALACVTMVVVGLLGVVPSGGVSLMILAAGAAGLATQGLVMGAMKISGTSGLFFSESRKEKLVRSFAKLNPQEGREVPSDDAPENAEDNNQPS